MSRLRVYLSGGFHSGWQDKVIEAVNQQVAVEFYSHHLHRAEVEFYDPRTSGLEFPRDYTAWDLQHLRMCDAVFAYMEASNPCGLGIALEVGYAKGLGKAVILVDERSGIDGEFARHFALARETAGPNVTAKLADGVQWLHGQVRMFNMMRGIT